MKRTLLTYLLAAAVIFVMTLPSCIGQQEQFFPWEVSQNDSTHTDPFGDTTKRSVIVLDFTATWCVNCPKMADAVGSLSENGINVIPIAVHYADEMACDASNALVKHFGVSALPVALFDFEGSLRTSTASVDILKSLSESSLSKTPGGCDITVEYEAGEGECRIDATISFLRDGTYSVAAALLEDGIVAPQVGCGDDYVHDNVLRAFLQKDFAGDPLGSRKKGESCNVSFRFNPDPMWNTGAMKAVVYILSDGDSPIVCGAKLTKITTSQSVL